MLWFLGEVIESLPLFALNFVCFYAIRKGFWLKFNPLIIALIVTIGIAVLPNGLEAVKGIFNIVIILLALCSLIPWYHKRRNKKDQSSTKS